MGEELLRAELSAAELLWPKLISARLLEAELLLGADEEFGAELLEGAEGFDAELLDAEVADAPEGVGAAAAAAELLLLLLDVVVAEEVVTESPFGVWFARAITPNRKQIERG